MIGICDVKAKYDASVLDSYWFAVYTAWLAPELRTWDQGFCGLVLGYGGRGHLAIFPCFARMS